MRSRFSGQQESEIPVVEFARRCARQRLFKEGVVVSVEQEKTLMRTTIMLLSLVLFASPLPLARAAASAAAQVPTASPCNGNMNIVRVSEIKPGMMAKFLEAVAAQKAWYKAAGTPDEIGVLRVMERNPETKVYAFSETEALTTHIEPAVRTKDTPHDAAYESFVALFRDSSSIKTQYVTCVGD